jgi:hypothetical protein
MKKQKEDIVNNKAHLPQIQLEYCKILITGSPKYDNKDMLFQTLEKITEKKEKVCVITSTYFTRGEDKKLRGVDHLAAEWSYKSKRSKRLVIFHPEECLTVDDMYHIMAVYCERAVVFSDGRDCRISGLIKTLKEIKNPKHVKVISI